MSDSTQNLIIVGASIIFIINYTLAIIIVDSIANLFSEIEKTGTPFTDRTIRLLRKVNITALILWLIGVMTGSTIISTGLLFVITISAFRTAFEYGYKLQKEVDEIL